MKLSTGDILKNKLTGFIHVASRYCTDPNDGKKYVFLRYIYDRRDIYEMGYWDEVSYVSKHYIKLKI